MNAFALRKEFEPSRFGEGAPLVAVVEPEIGTRWTLMTLLRTHGIEGIACEDAASLLFLMHDVRLDAIVLESRLPGMDGLALFQRLSLDPQAPSVVFLSEGANVAEAVHCLRLGAVDFVEKSEDPARILSAIQRAVRRSRQAMHRRSMTLEAQRALSALSPREKETFDCLVRGSTTEAVALELGIALQTAKVHRSRVMQKLGVRSVADLVRLDAARQGKDWSLRPASGDALDPLEAPGSESEEIPLVAQPRQIVEGATASIPALFAIR